MQFTLSLYYDMLKMKAQKRSAVYSLAQEAQPERAWGAIIYSSKETCMI